MEKLSLLLSDVMCPICWNIIIEPVTMPCKHELCLPCFKQNVHEANLECPVCRTRISAWTRKSTRENNLVNKRRWKQIQEAFPDKVRMRMQGIEDDISISEFSPCPIPLSEPGEIRTEYERQLKRFQDEEERERELETQASKEFIQKLQLEELQMVEQHRSEQESITARDAIIARELSRRFSELQPLDDSTVVNTMLKELNTDLCMLSPRSESAIELRLNGTMSASSSRMCASALARDFRTTIDISTPSDFCNKGSSALRSTSVESHDSITSEMCHFKPITAAPKTPPKRLPDGRFMEPEVVQIKARKLSYSPEEPFSQVLAKKVKTVVEKSHEEGTAYTSTPLSCAEKAKGIDRKIQGRDLSAKENNPFYPESSPIAPKRPWRMTLEEMVNHKRRISSTQVADVEKQDASAGNAKHELSARITSEACVNSSCLTQNETESSCNEEPATRLQQEKDDLKLARKLHKEMNYKCINRSAGSGNEYYLRCKRKLEN